MVSFEVPEIAQKRVAPISIPYGAILRFPSDEIRVIRENVIRREITRLKPGQGPDVRRIDGDGVIIVVRSCGHGKPLTLGAAQRGFLVECAIGDVTHRVEVGQVDEPNGVLPIIFGFFVVRGVVNHLRQEDFRCAAGWHFDVLPVKIPLVGMCLIVGNY